MVLNIREAGVALRASFLIDKNGVVRHQVVNDLPLGRNIDEMYVWLMPYNSRRAQ